MKPFDLSDLALILVAKSVTKFENYYIKVDERGAVLQIGQVVAFLHSVWESRDSLPPTVCL